MNETEKGKKHQGLMIAGLVVLILALMLGVTLIFAGLESIVPPTQPGPYTALTGEDGQPAPYGLRLLDGEARQAGDIQDWLDNSREWIAGGGATQESSVFWLYRKKTDEYVLYLPGQDRALAAADFTATQEKDGDGEYTLVLRARTPEGGEAVVPEEQLFSFQTTSEQWRGIRVKVILDGRERYVYKLTSTQWGRLFSTEEMYIGRF